MTIPTNPIYQDAPESFFLVRFFEQLNDKNIRYAVMRNHEHLPYSGGGSDLDVIVAAEDGIRFRALVLSAVCAAGGVPIGIAESIGFFKLYVFGRVPDKAYRWWGIRLDINIGLYFKGHSILIDPAPWPTKSYRSISVLSDGFAGVLGVLKEVLNNGTYPSRYARAARQGVATDWPNIKALIAPMGSKAIAQFRKIVVSHCPGKNQAAECRALHNMVVRHAMLPHLGTYVWERLAYEGYKLRRYFNPSGKIVAILGTDGVGKTTIINAIKPVLDDATHNATIVKHLRPNLLPPLASLKGKNKVGESANGQTVDPHGSTPSGFLGSIIRLIYLLLDYVFGYWLKTRPAIAKQPTVIIFDRYAYDIELDPRRFRIDLPGQIIRLFTRFVPKPDLIICLYGEPEEISLRKQELPMEEVKRQTEALLEFAERESHAVLVSTNGTVEQARDAVLLELQKYCTKKSKGALCAE